MLAILEITTQLFSSLFLKFKVAKPNTSPPLLLQLH